MEIQPTSFRFDADFLELLDAWAEQLSRGQLRSKYRADVIHLALRRLDPSKAQGGPSQRLTSAYTTVFHREET